MSLAPLKRFLGLDEPADARTLLGLGSGEHDGRVIAAALKRRLDQVADHPAADSADAEEVRQRLRAAAAAFVADPTPPHRAGRGATRPAAAPVRPGSRESTLNPKRPRVTPSTPTAAPSGPRGTSRAPIQLTSFDQQVLAVLVASRGWNAEARSKLVSMASAYGVSVQGLVKVIAGLSEYAKAGGPRLGVTEITSGRAHLEALPGLPSRRSSADPISSALLRRIGEQLDAERPGVRVRLVASAAAVTILAGVLLVWLLLPEPVTSETPDGRAGTGDAAARVVAPSPTRERPRAEPSDEGVFAARFERIPTFIGNGLPEPAAEAADDAPRAAEQLDALARQLTVDPSLSLADVRRWRDAVTIVGSGWVLLDGSTRRQIAQLVLDAVYVAADDPSVSDELIGMLAPQPPGSDPLDLWRGAWNAGTLGSIAGGDTVPAVAAQRARQELEEVLETRLDVTALNFRDAADRWLRSQIDRMMTIAEFDDRVEDRWELWIAAQRELGTGTRFDGAMLEVLETALRGPVDLARPGPTANLMGRMILLIDFSGRPRVRERVVGWFDDPGITISDLWVLTSLLSLHDRTPWFDNELVLPLDADPAMRRRVASLIGRRWATVLGPDREREPPAGRGVVVDPGLLAAWRDTADRLDNRVASRGRSVRELAAAARLNSAAAMLAAGRPGDARFQLEEAEAILSGDPLPFGDRTRPGQAVGNDGAWAAGYAEAARNLEQRLTRLRSLRSSAGTDLGPTDARMLVHEALRGSPTEVRSLAQSIIIEYFASGPNVAIELVDQLPDALPNEGLSELVAHVTGVVLPPVRSERWDVEARHAVAEHTATLIRDDGPPTDALAAIVARAYAARLTRFGRTLGVGDDVPPAHEIARELTIQWQQQTAGVMASVDVPADLSTLAHRDAIRQRLARGPIQAFVAAQLSLLELLAHQAAAEQPRRAGELAELLEGAQQRRDQMTHVIEQSVDAERTMTAIWAIRLVTEERS